MIPFWLGHGSNHVARVFVAMTNVLQRSRAARADCARQRFDIARDRYVIFSDTHRGARNPADDFRQNERAYSAALAYYLRLGYVLVLLGDVEELWEERPQPVLSAYEYVVELEAQFHRQGRYLRIWGNHDDEWRYPDQVERYLAPLYQGPPLHVYEGLLLDVVDGEETLGEIFLVHGHQGDAKSSRWSWITRRLIRYLWRPFQRAFRVPVNTPATSWDLRHRLNRAMYTWAEQQPDLILVAAHTHSPVFKSLSHEAQLQQHLEDLEKRAGPSPSPAELEAQARLLARLEWLRGRAREMQRQEHGSVAVKPCYFNVGCCCYDDGDITGIELADEEIRLVRWPNRDREPLPEILARDAIRDVYASI
ncbi:MAG: metallophosphoesterase [Anaerolineae bacterium]